MCVCALNLSHVYLHRASKMRFKCQGNLLCKTYFDFKAEVMI